ncbi:MAG: hypothetical protein LBU66_03215 [Treponema sp.]|jgi:hypothetical protein|nr:hypothetical protein [Treponema sp.]
MIRSSDFFSNLLNAILPNRAAPVLARVMKVYEGSGKNKYSVDVRVLKLGTLEDTDQVIAEVPISLIWAGKKKRGLYAIPNEDQVVIIEFLGWNPAYPYVAGMWSDEYDADDFGKDKFIITDGEGMKIIIDAVEKCVSLDNGNGCTVKLEKGKKITADNSQLQVVLNGDKCAVKNGSQSLFTILDTHFENLMGAKTVGSPANHQFSPDDVKKFNKDKTDLGLLLEA